jgi:chromate transporter
VKLLPALRRNVLGAAPAYAFAALMFACIGLLRVPLLWMLVGLGAVAVALAWRKLKP